MKKIKKIAIAGLCCFAAVAGGVLLQNDATSVSAEGTFTSVHDVEGHFYMDNGAAVRLNEGSSGIRFETYVSQDWYNYASNNGEKTVTFYTSIDKDGNTDSGEAKIVLAKEALSFDEKTNLYRFTGAIVYDNLDEATDAVKVEAHNMQLVGKAYAVIDDGTTQTTVWADTDDNVRSMAEVADSTIKLEGTEVDGNVIDKYTPSEETVLKSYYTSKKKTMYVENTGATLDVTPEFAGAKVLKVAMQDTNDTYNAGALTFNDDVATATAASDAYATVYTDKGIVETNFKVCTAVITNVTDFVTAFNVDANITGYYYLANDIAPKQDGSYEIVKLTKGISSAKAFKGTFDGGGHTLNLEVGNGNGVFAYLYGATVKNARFNLKMAANAGWLNAGLAQYSFGENYLSDVYVNVENLSTACNTFGAITPYYNGHMNYTRVVIETPTAEELSGYNTAKMGAIAKFIGYMDATAGTDWQMSKKLNTDVFVISSLPIAVALSNQEVAWTVYARNQMTDTNGDGRITRDDIDTTNKITFVAQESSKLYSYTSVADLIAKQHNLAAYEESGYWSISTGAPVWEGNN